ncbi:MAG: cytidylate kinase [Candidatus Binatia bacterium]|nr:MAG: cytidylate kinase [Candidatus Binatia bacterium]
MIVAIDGPAGAGKSTVGKLVARRLGFRYVDSGAMYRAVGVLAAERGLPFDDEASLVPLCEELEVVFESDGVRILAGGRDLTEALRTADAGQWASRVSVLPGVRARLVERQRALARGGDVVMEGRDIGTVVCPDAEVKIYLDAEPRERAERRARELEERGERVDRERILREIEERDRRDRERSTAPLRPAPDAVRIDTTGRTLEEVVARVVSLVRAKAAP